MTTELAAKRKSRLTMLAGIAGAIAALAALTLAIEARSTHANQAMGAAIPRLESQVSQAQRITIITPDVSYHLEKVAHGADSVWVMHDRSDYPIADGAVDTLFKDLEGLQTLRRMTNDKSKHERLGVTDPREGGRGILVQVEDSGRALLVDYVFGIEPSGAIYMRKPNEAQTWSVRGAMPSLRQARTWMSLKPLDIEPTHVARTEIQPPEGPAYVLARSGVDGSSYEIASPRVPARQVFRLAATAQRLMRIEAVDVQSAPAVQGAPKARVRVSVDDGLTLEAEVIASGGSDWMKLVARAQGPEQEEAALALNGRVAEWAFQLSPEDSAALAPPLSAFTAEPGIN